MLESFVRAHLNLSAPRTMVVLDPIRLNITNFAEGVTREIEVSGEDGVSGAGASTSLVCSLHVVPTSLVYCNLVHCTSLAICNLVPPSLVYCNLVPYRSGNLEFMVPTSLVYCNLVPYKSGNLQFSAYKSGRLQFSALYKSGILEFMVPMQVWYIATI